MNERNRGARPSERAPTETASDRVAAADDLVVSRTEQITALEDALENIPPTLALAAALVAARATLAGLASALEVDDRSIQPVPSRLGAGPGRPPTEERDPEAVVSIGTSADPCQLPVRVAGGRP